MAGVSDKTLQIPGTFFTFPIRDSEITYALLDRHLCLGTGDITLDSCLYKFVKWRNEWTRHIGVYCDEIY